MSRIKMTVRDRAGAVYGEPHAAYTGAAVAALAADPETIEEWRTALERFLDEDESAELAWREGESFEPCEGGICIIDLAARLIVVETDYEDPEEDDSLPPWSEENWTELAESFRLASDWAFRGDPREWRGLAESRRRQRIARPPLDARRVLYDEVCPFIVDECLAARNPSAARGEWSPPEGWQLRELPERLREKEAPTSADAVAEIHARWLMAARSDLEGRTPREILAAERPHIDGDLESRRRQWSSTGRCPQPIPRESAAYRFGLFGTHETLVYYDLVRHLVWECWDRNVDPEDGPPPASPDRREEIRNLREERDRWLAVVCEDLSSYKTPAEIIEEERRRIPWAVTGEEAMVDEDCPLCQMMVEDLSPMFCHLDDCNNDREFPFSLHATRQEWEEEERRYEEFDKRLNEESGDDDGAADDWESPLQQDGPWERSFTSTDPETDSPAMVLFGLACLVTELEQDLNDSSRSAALAGSVNRHFSNLRSVITEPQPEMVAPVLARLCEQLAAVAEALPELSAKCDDLEGRLRRFVSSLGGEVALDDDMPF